MASSLTGPCPRRTRDRDHSLCSPPREQPPEGGRRPHLQPQASLRPQPHTRTGMDLPRLRILDASTYTHHHQGSWTHHEHLRTTPESMPAFHHEDAAFLSHILNLHVLNGQTCVDTTRLRRASALRPGQKCAGGRTPGGQSKGPASMWKGSPSPHEDGGDGGVAGYPRGMAESSGLDDPGPSLPRLQERP